MPTVNTVLGPVDVNNLGFTLTHEHVRVRSSGVAYTFPELFDHEEDLARGVAVLNEAAAEGVGTIIDVTTMDPGRDIPRHIGLGTTPDQLARADPGGETPFGPGFCGPGLHVTVDAPRRLFGGE